jgi:acetyl-CoA carboxylase biotin carboxyl carrier protein
MNSLISDPFPLSWIEILKQASATLREFDLTKIEIENQGICIRIERHIQHISGDGKFEIKTETKLEHEQIESYRMHKFSSENIPLQQHTIPEIPTISIKAKMVGTAYLAPSPNASPFIALGQTVKKGDILLIIEAMKVMNQVKSTVSGVVKKICIEDGGLVEFDQILVEIAPNP